MKKFAIAAAVSALVASTSVAMAEVKVAPEGAKTLIRSTGGMSAPDSTPQDMVLVPAGNAGSANLSPGLVLAGVAGLIGIAAFSSGSH